MAVKYVHTVSCDTEGCENKTVSTDENHREGWMQIEVANNRRGVGVGDYCPDCTESDTFDFARALVRRSVEEDEGFENWTKVGADWLLNNGVAPGIRLARLEFSATGDKKLKTWRLHAHSSEGTNVLVSKIAGSVSIDYPPFLVAREAIDEWATRIMAPIDLDFDI
jgi:hypothetical protein